MNFYVYNEAVPLGKETLGSFGKHIWRDLKTLRGAIKRAESYGWKEFSIYSFTNIYDDNTFKFLYRKEEKEVSSVLGRAIL